jgi:AcrR family transcriptional regulator
VGRAARRVSTAYRSEENSECKLRAAFDAYASEVVAEPKAARLALVEVLSAGPSALAERERARQAFEHMVSSSLSDGPGGVELPAVVVKAIVGGVERITRLRLLGGDLEELPALADELLAWAVSYASPAVVELPSVCVRDDSWRRSRPRHTPVGSERTRILRSAAQIAATAGYAHLTRSRIVEQSHVSVERFDELFGSTEQCFLDALDLLGVEALASAATASANAEDAFGAVHQGIAALMAHVACNRVLQRVAFVEIFAAGPAGVQRRERLLGRFTELLVRTLPESQRPSELIANAIIGGIWTILHHFVTRGAARQLPAFADQITYIALASLIGAEAAIETILVDSPGDSDALGA